MDPLPTLCCYCRGGEDERDRGLNSTPTQWHYSINRLSLSIKVITRGCMSLREQVHSCGGFQGPSLEGLLSSFSFQSSFSRHVIFCVILPLLCLSHTIFLLSFHPHIYSCLFPAKHFRLFLEFLDVSLNYLLPRILCRVISHVFLSLF